MSLAAAAGAGVAGVESANAEVVQITNFGNYVSGLGSTFFNTDLSGDGAADVPTWAASFGQIHPTPNYFSYFAALSQPGRRRTLNPPPGNEFLAYVVNKNTAGTADPFYAKVFGISPFLNTAGGSAKGHVQIGFTDTRINGGDSTLALIELVTSSDRTTPGTGTADGTRVTITRLIFDDSDANGAALPTSSAGVQNSYPEFAAVPEPSALALLTLGAAGVLARRRRKVSSL